MAIAPSDYVPPDGHISIAAAARWCAFHFRMSVSVARQYFLNAFRSGHLAAYRADDTGPVPSDEAALWNRSLERFWNRELGDLQVGVELPLVRWSDARAVLARYFFEPNIAAPWPERTPWGAWAG